MKLRQYLQQINELVREDKSILDFDVIYSTDDEGNAFSNVYFSPTIGTYDGDYEFQAVGDENNSQKPNAVCIN